MTLAGSFVTQKGEKNRLEGFFFVGGEKFRPSEGALEASGDDGLVGDVDDLSSEEVLGAGHDLGEEESVGSGEAEGGMIVGLEV